MDAARYVKAEECVNRSVSVALYLRRTRAGRKSQTRLMGAVPYVEISNIPPEKRMCLLF